MNFNASHFFIVYISSWFSFDLSSQGPRYEKTGRSIFSSESDRVRTSLRRILSKGNTLPIPDGQLILLWAGKFSFVSRNHSRWSSRPSYRPQSSRHSGQNISKFSKIRLLQLTLRVIVFTHDASSCSQRYRDAVICEALPNLETVEQGEHAWPNSNINAPNNSFAMADTC